MNWEMKTLGEIGEWGSGGTPFSSQPEYYNGAIPWLIIEDLNDGIVTSSQKTITELGLKNSSAKIVEPGTLLIAMYGSIGKLGIAGISCATNQAIAFCRCNPELIDVNFLFYYLLFSREKLLDMGRGNTQQNIGQAVLKEYPVPLPPLPEQRRIAALLRRADHLRRMQRYADGLSAALLQSVFLEMFGNPAINPKNWKTKTLRECSLIFSDGPFGSDLKTEHYQENGVRVVRLQNIGAGDFLDSDKAFVTQEHFESLKKHRCLPGDVIIGTLGDPNLRACILPAYIPIALNKADCVQMRANPKYINPFFACSLLNMPQTLYLANGMIHGQTRSRINMGRLAELEIPVPPLPEQERFAGVVRRVEALRRRQAEARRQAEGLFQALLAQSFELV